MYLGTRNYLHFQSTSSVNFVFFSANFAILRQQEFVRKVVKKLGSFSIAKSVNSTTTHVVAGNQRRTLNILNAVVQGCWILSPNWVSIFTLFECFFKTDLLFQFQTLKQAASSTDNFRFFLELLYLYNIECMKGDKVQSHSPV